MVSSFTRRRAIQQSIEKGLGGVAQACRAVRLSRSAYYRTGRPSAVRRQIQARVVRLSQAHPRYGYRRITVLLRRAGVKFPRNCGQAGRSSLRKNCKHATNTSHL